MRYEFLSAVISVLSGAALGFACFLLLGMDAVREDVGSANDVMSAAVMAGFFLGVPFGGIIGLGVFTIDRLIG